MNPSRAKKQKKAPAARNEAAKFTLRAFLEQVQNPAHWFGFLILILPLVYFRPALNQFGPLRVGLLSLSLLAFIVFFVFRRPETSEFPISRKAPLTASAFALLFFAQLLFSTLFAVNKEEALYASLQFGLYLISAFLAVYSFRSGQFSVTPLFKAAVLALALQSLAGIIQFYGILDYCGKHFGVTFETLNINAVKPYALMHNRNLFSSFCALLAPLCIYLLYTGSPGWKATSALALWLSLFSLIIGQTRSAWLALAAAFIVINVAVLLLRKRMTAQFLRGWAIGLVAFVFGSLLALILAATIPNKENLNQSLQQRFSTLTRLFDRVLDSDEELDDDNGSRLRDNASTPDTSGGRSSNEMTVPSFPPKPTPTPAPTPALKDSSPTNRVDAAGASSSTPQTNAPPSEPISNTQESVNVRFFFWGKCLEMMLDKPLLGVGPANWRISVQKYDFYGTHDWFLKGGGVYLPDWAHNLYLQTGAETGISGLAFFLAMWISMFVIAIRILWHSTRADHLILALSLLAAILIYAVDCSFSFPNKSPAHSFFLSLIFALLVIVYEQTEWPAGKNPPTVRLSKTLWLMPVALLLMTSYLGYARLHFETYMRKAIRNCAAAQYPQAIVHLNQARIPWVSLAQRPFPLDYYRTLAYIELKDFDLALSASENALKFNPWNIVLLNTKGYILSRMKRHDDAIIAYKETLAVAPKFEQALKNLAAAYYSKGMYKEASDALLQTAYAGSKGFVLMLGSSLLNLKDYPKAAEVFRAGHKSLPPSPEIVENLVWLESVKLKDPTNALIHLQQLKELNPAHPKLAEYERVIRLLQKQ